LVPALAAAGRELSPRSRFDSDVRPVPLFCRLLVAACAAEPSDEPEKERDPGLSGLYEGIAEAPEGAGAGDRLCLVGGEGEGEGEGKGESEARQARLAFVTLGGAITPGRAACSGLGTARREGGPLVVTLAGDGDCSFTAAIEDDRIAFPAEVPAGCAYYWSAQASLAGRDFVLVEAGRAAARRARDLVGDPLCP